MKSELVAVLKNAGIRLSLSLWVMMGLTVTAGIQAADYRFESGSKKVKLVELYTSQGCSSCPPAENWLGRFKNDPRIWKEIVPVAFHVTYWDYLGWSDPFGVDGFNQRQLAYKQEGLLRSVYTPGLVVDGTEWRGWFRGKTISPEADTTGNLVVQLKDRSLAATYSSPDSKTPLQLNIALLGIDMNTHIKAGENSGKKLPQNFVALYFMQFTSESAEWRIELPTPNINPERLALAAWITHKPSQSPLQATGGWVNF